MSERNYRIALHALWWQGGINDDLYFFMREYMFRSATVREM